MKHLDFPMIVMTLLMLITTTSNANGDVEETGKSAIVIQSPYFIRFGFSSPEISFITSENIIEIAWHMLGTVAGVSRGYLVKHNLAPDREFHTDPLRKSDYPMIEGAVVGSMMVACIYLGSEIVEQINPVYANDTEKTHPSVFLEFLRILPTIILTVIYECCR